MSRDNLRLASTKVSQNSSPWSISMDLDSFNDSTYKDVSKSSRYTQTNADTNTQKRTHKHIVLITLNLVHIQHTHEKFRATNILAKSQAWWSGGVHYANLFDILLDARTTRKIRHTKSWQTKSEAALEERGDLPIPHLFLRYSVV